MDFVVLSTDVFTINWSINFQYYHIKPIIISFNIYVVSEWVLEERTSNDVSI